MEVVNVNLADKPKWFLEKNPLGKVPTIEQDGKVYKLTCLRSDVVANEWIRGGGPKRDY